MTKVGIDLKLFEILVSRGESMSLVELTQATGADPVLVARILRYLAAFHLLAETGVDRFQATPATQALTVPGFAAGIKHQSVLSPRPVLSCQHDSRLTTHDARLI